MFLSNILNHIISFLMKDHHLNRGKRELPPAVRVVKNTQKTSSPNTGSVSRHRQTVQTEQRQGVTSRTLQAKTPTQKYCNGRTHFKAPTRQSHRKGPDGSGIAIDVSVVSFFIDHRVLHTLLWLF